MNYSQNHYSSLVSEEPFFNQRVLLTDSSLLHLSLIVFEQRQISFEDIGDPEPASLIIKPHSLLNLLVLKLLLDCQGRIVHVAVSAGLTFVTLWRQVNSHLLGLQE